MFFIDPLGPTFVHFSHLQPILKRNQKITELIINFDTDGLYRIACASLSEKTLPKTAETNAINVTKIIGSDNWKQILADKNLTAEQGETRILDEYKNNLRKFGYYVEAYPIREALDKKPKYHFVYCTRHPDGIVLMNDFIRDEEDLLYGEHIEMKSPLFHQLNLADKEINLRREKLRPIMGTYFQTHRRVNRTQMIKDLIFVHFGQFHSKDHRAVFKEFIDSQVLRTTDNETRIDDRIYNYFSKS